MQNNSHLINLYKDDTLPISIEQAKKQCRVDTTDDDTYIEDLIWRATELVEGETNIDLRPCQWELQMRCFPRNLRAKIYLPRLPLLSVDDFSYFQLDGEQKHLTGYDFDDTATALATAPQDQGYFVISPAKTPGWVQPVYWWPSCFWLSTNFWLPWGVSITFTSGFDTSGTSGWSGVSGPNIPAAAQHALCLMVASWYENREDPGEVRLYENSAGFQRLCDVFSSPGVC